MKTPYLDKMIDDLENHIDAVTAGSYAGIPETRAELAEYESIKEQLSEAKEEKHIMRKLTEKISDYRDELEEENTKLKGLLSKCKTELKEWHNAHPTGVWEDDKALMKELEALTQEKGE